MDLYAKLIKIYPDLTIQDFHPHGGILLLDNSDGKGAYIAEWNHPTLAKPTDAQLAATGA